MKSARILGPIIILMSIVMVVSMLSCGGGGGGAQLDGTWTLTTQPDGANPPVGDGTYTIIFSGSTDALQTDYYSGDGVIGGVSYKINISRKWTIDDDGNDYYLFLSQGDVTNSIKFYGTLSGFTSASGQYIGQVEYEDYGTGIFGTMKQ